ncbi:MAG TPA: MOSC N-terminal beta barrel domain-containing protein [Bryobacteraceae bacterium]|nr:MOSC N-terminal beta barrel domain-containing protein [Bryobacteraceae bacterium]
MPLTIGHVEALYRYPVKSMAGESLHSANLGWHGIEGDRRLALRRLEDRGGGFPWLTAGKFPDLIRFTPERGGTSDLPTHIRTPDGQSLPIFSEELAAEIARRYNSPVEMMHYKHGIFDEGTISLIASDTICELSRLAGLNPDVRRFRPNILVKLLQPIPFQEDDWVGCILSFGESADAPAVSVTLRDERCAMLNLDPDTAQPNPEMLKAVVHAHQNTAGVYAAVTRTGKLAVGQPIILNRH